MIVVKKLDNGISVALEELPYARSIAFGIWVKNGSRNERPFENGVSHFIEHMMFKGTEHRTAKDIAEEMDILGGQINAYTTKEHTCYHTRVLDTHFDRALDVMSDMLLHPLIAQKDVEKERNVITEEIYMYEDAPEELVHDALQDSIWRESSLGMPILGTEETISAFTADSIREYYERNYHTENIVLSAAGHFKTEEMFEKLNEKLGGWKRGKPFLPYETKAFCHHSEVLREKDVEQVHCCIAFPSFPANHPTKYAMAVFNTLFGDGMSSRLFQKIREENGLTYSIYSYRTVFRDTGLFSVYAGMNPNQAEKTFSLAAKELERAKKKPFPEKLVEAVKEQLISSFLMGTESTMNHMTACGGSLLMTGKVEQEEEILSHLRAVTAEDVLEAARRVIDFEKLSFSAVGNLKGNDFPKLMKQIFS